MKDIKFKLSVGWIILGILAIVLREAIPLYFNGLKNEPIPTIPYSQIMNYPTGIFIIYSMVLLSIFVGLEFQAHNKDKSEGGE